MWVASNLSLQSSTAFERAHDQRVQFVYVGGHFVQLFERVGGEGRVLPGKHIGIFADVFGIVADAFEIGDRAVVAAELAFAVSGQGVGGQLDVVGGQLFEQKVEVVFARAELFAFFEFAVADRADRPVQVLLRDLRHQLYLFAHLRKRDGRRSEQSFVDVRELVGDDAVFVRLLLFVADDKLGQPRQILDESNQQDGRRHVEYRMEHRDLRLDLGERRGEPLVDGKTQRKDEEHDGAEHVEHEVDHRRALAVGRRADGSEHRGHAGADVDAECEENRALEVDQADARHRDQDACSRRRTLNDRGDHKPDEQQEEGVAHRRDRVADRLGVAETLHRRAHHFEPDEDHTDAAHQLPRTDDLVVLGKHHHERAHARQRAEECGDRQELKRDDLRGDRGADVRAHNDRGRLAKGHNARVDKADHHDRRRRRALDDRRHPSAYRDAGKAV